MLGCAGRLVTARVGTRVGRACAFTRKEQRGRRRPPAPDTGRLLAPQRFNCRASAQSLRRPQEAILAVGATQRCDTTASSMSLPDRYAFAVGDSHDADAVATYEAMARHYVQDLEHSPHNALYERPAIT